jgi:hypothetical protein
VDDSGLAAEADTLQSVCDRNSTVTNNTVSITNSVDGDGVIQATNTHANGYGLYGHASATTSTNYGVFGRADGTICYGVRGWATATGAVQNFGVAGTAAGNSGTGVFGRAYATGAITNTGVYGEANGDTGRGVWGETTGDQGCGVYGRALSGTSAGVHGTAQGPGGRGVYGYSWIGYAIHGESLVGEAGYFEGTVVVTGSLSKGSGSFLIDHPLDPKNKVLRHSFVESPEMTNVYKGRTKLVNGRTTIRLPDYFDALNHPEGREISLTCVGGWSPLYLDGEIEGNHFVVRTTKDGNADQEFSWVVYAVRNDAFARKNPIVVEEDKGGTSKFTKGEYLHPEAFGEMRRMSELAQRQYSP